MGKVEAPFYSHKLAGSIGDETYYMRQGLQLVRHRAGPVDQAAGNRYLARDVFAQTSPAWTALSPAQRAAWHAAAGGFPSGRHLWMSRTFWGAYLGVGAPTEPVKPEPPPQISGFWVLQDPYNPLGDAEWQNADTPPSATFVAIIMGSFSGSIGARARASYLVFVGAAYLEDQELLSIRGDYGQVLYRLRVLHIPSGAVFTAAAFTDTFPPP